MAGSSLLLLIDDIAAALDDVAVMTKVAAKKTAGVLGDDLALNAEQVSGVRAERELPVVWAVAKGSLVNKAILVPAALLISWFAPWLITPMLMLGGAYLCFEGVEKIAHKLLLNDKEEAAEEHALEEALHNPAIDMVEFEKEKIQGAIRTDFVLSAEIIVITLGAVAAAAFMTQVATVVAVALIMTIGVYGFVALIVKLDDIGLYLLRAQGNSASIKFKHQIGKGLLVLAPALMKLLAKLGTLAMFLVGGGILVHGIPAIHELTHGLEGMGDVVMAVANATVSILFGVLSGAVVLACTTIIRRIFVSK